MTEKIARGRDIHGKEVVILKHTPCEIHACDLHAGGSVLTEGSERMLSYLPRVLYLKFPGAEWQVHAGLGIGVSPLRPVRREWTLNSASKAKVSRHGFTVVPDYASTGFMMQGATLAAEIAECGDIFSIPGLTEVLATYVILSRVKNANLLLLLRAFCPLMFRMGAPPGPACLLELLRRRFGGSGEAGQEPYTLTEARGDI